MTTGISEQVRARALSARGSERRQSTRLGRLVIGVTLFGIAAGVTGLVLIGLDIALADSHLAVYAAACLVLAGLASALLVWRAMLADCLAESHEFYRRGQLEGWNRGWNGLPPETSDPLLK